MDGNTIGILVLVAFVGILWLLVKVADQNPLCQFHRQQEKVSCRKSTVQGYECEAEVTYPFTGKRTCIDACLLKEMFWLWDQGIETGGCCCGRHVNASEGMATILVETDSIQLMRDLGYKHIEDKPAWWFTPKTKL